MCLCRAPGSEESRSETLVQIRDVYPGSKPSEMNLMVEIFGLICWVLRS